MVLVAVELGGIFVGVGVTVAVRVRVGKMIDTGVRVLVAVAYGVRVAKFGTHMICPIVR